MGQHQIEEGHGSATVILPQGTIIDIQSAIFAPKAMRNLLSFRDIRANDLHIHTGISNEREVLHITSKMPMGTGIKQTLPAFPLGFYVTKT